MLFLIAATWIERRTINLRWFGIAALMGILLMIVNVARVGLLVLIGQVVGLQLVAEFIHVPLGVLAFGIVCGVVLLLIRTQSPSESRSSPQIWQTYPDTREGPGLMKRPVWLAPLLAACITGMALVYSPRPQPVMAQAAINWVFSAELQVQANPLSPELFAWVTGDGADFADRWDFTWQGEHDQIRGTVMFVTSTTWRAQHRPDRCFMAHGITVESTQIILFDENFSAQFVLVSGGPQQATALYWLQSGERATDDFATRIWSDLEPERRPWVLVTVLFDDVYPLDSDEIHAIAKLVRRAVTDSLEGGLP
jgi:exosortase O